MLSSGHIRAARALLRWSVRELAATAGIHTTTVRRMERRDGPPRVTVESLRKVQGALEAAGVEFIDADNGGPGVRLGKGLSPESARAGAE